MLKVAFRVNNLSDARYFAAYGFDWIIFDFGPGGSAHRHLLHGIAEWIAGSRIGITVYDRAELDYFVSSHPDIDGYYLGAVLNGDIPADKVIFASWNNAHDGHHETYHLVTSYEDATHTGRKYLLDITGLDPETTVIDENRIDGVCLAGDEEDRPGFKNFERQDRWIEIIAG